MALQPVIHMQNWATCHTGRNGKRMTERDTVTKMKRPKLNCGWVWKKRKVGKIEKQKMRMTDEGGEMKAMEEGGGEGGQTASLEGSLASRYEKYSADKSISNTARFKHPRKQE